MICKETDQEILIALLSHLPFESFEYTDKGVKAYLQSQYFTTSFAKECESIIQNLNCSLSWHKIEEENWNKTWETNFQPVEIEDFCRIRAPFHDSIDDFEYEIVINPEMAFGTGHHETTFMMISAMRNIDFTNKKVLDFGCGTGILAIQADFQLAKEIDAVDNDEKAIRNTISNCKLNKAINVNVELSTDAIVSYGTFDLILANINKNVLIQFTARLNELLVQGGQLLMSGILISDMEEMISLYESSAFKLSDKRTKGEWSCLVFDKIK
jgi:ribosomal protein L11 methyltransferase